MAFGTLPHIILHKLAKKPHTGYELMKAIEQDIGKKPSFGNIYPTLERLKAKGLISCEQDGRKKIYSITPKGKQEVKRFKEVHDRIIRNIIAETKACSMIAGDDFNPTLEIMNKIRQGQEPFGKTTHSMTMLRDTIIYLARDNTLDKKHKEINKILNDANYKLKALKKRR